MIDVTADQQRQPPRLSWRELRSSSTAAAVNLYRSAKAWRLSPGAYGAAGMLLLSASAGLRFGLWAGLGLLGVCCCRIDARR